MSSATKLKILHTNVVDLSSISIYTETPVTGTSYITDSNTAPLSNLKSNNKSRVFRKTYPAVTTETSYKLLVKLELPKSMGIDSICILQHNLPTGSSFSIRGRDTIEGPNLIEITSNANTFTAGVLGWGDFPWDVDPWYSNNVNGNRYNTNIETHITQRNTSVKFIILSITVPVSSVTPETDYMEIGRLYIGRVYQPTYNFSYGYQITYKDDTKNSRTYGGNLVSTVTSPVYKTISLDIKYLDKYNRSLLADLLKFVGKRRDVVVSLFPSDDDSFNKRSEYLLHCRLTRDMSISEVAPEIFSTSTIELEEI
jgi:hypothetical protein